MQNRFVRNEVSHGKNLASKIDHFVPSRFYRHYFCSDYCFFSDDESVGEESGHERKCGPQRTHHGNGRAYARDAGRYRSFEKLESTEELNPFFYAAPDSNIFDSLRKPAEKLMDLKIRYPAIDTIYLFRRQDSRILFQDGMTDLERFGDRAFIEDEAALSFPFHRAVEGRIENLSKVYVFNSDENGRIRCTLVKFLTFREMKAISF